jgi:LPXTG-site transpeptidase (sortase) family protein
VKGKERGTIITPLVIGLLLIGILTAVFIIVTSPSSAISTAQLPGGLTVGVSGLRAAPATPSLPPPRLPNSTAIPDLTPSVSPDQAEPTPTPTLEPTKTPLPEETATPEPEPTATPTPAPVGIIPARLRIPSIGVDAKVEKVGQTKDGAMDTPKNIWDVAWYEPGTKPGELGSAVIAGHLDGPHTQAIFWDLNKLKPGQRLFLDDGKGQELTFEVMESEAYPFDKAPLDKIFLTSGDIYLNLITCNGTFDYRSLNYDKRLVVYTKLVKDGQ